MITEWKLFIYLGVFMAPLGIAYGVVSSDLLRSEPEEAGTLLLVVTAIAFLFVGLYLRTQAKRMDGLRPEDYNATPDQGAGEVGSFPVGSIFPFMAAMGATTASLGIVFNGFLAVPGTGLLIFAIIGMARESTIAETGHMDLDSQANPAAQPVGEFDQAQVKK